MSESISIKLVAVGDGGCGKNQILRKYGQLVSNQKQAFTVFDNLAVQIQVKGTKVNLGLWDTAGAQEYNRLRPLAFPNADVFLIVFSLHQRSSFVNATKKWYPQLKQNMSGSPIIFVGVQMEGSEKINITNDKIGKEAKTIIEEKLNCKYMECNLKNNQGLTNVFTQAVCLTQKYMKKIQLKKQQKKTCQIF